MHLEAIRKYTSFKLIQIMGRQVRTNKEEEMDIAE